MGAKLSAAEAAEAQMMLSPSENAALDERTLQHDEPSGDLVLQQVHKFLGRFVAFPGKHEHTAAALWAVHCHMMDRWESTPRLACLSAEPGSGKTRVLEILELLVPRPVAAINVSPAYLFRRVADENGPPTILFDEIDTVFGPKAKENEELRAFLNAGHRRGAVAGRCVIRGKSVETEDLPAYCAVAVAGLGWLPDTILSRSVIVRMRRRHAGETVEPFRHRQHGQRGDEIRRRIALWAATQPDVVTWPELPPTIQDRDADVWEALIAVADLAGGDWPKLAREAAVALVAASKEADPSLGIRLLADTRIIFAGKEMLSSKVMLDHLLGMEESPWADIRGKPLDQRGLAHRLRQYGIKSKTIRVGDATPKGYVLTDFQDAWARYVPSPEKSATSATEKTTQSFQSDDVADVADRVAAPILINGRKISDVADVAHLPPKGTTCAQCGSDDVRSLQRMTRGKDSVWLHRECRRFYLRPQQRDDVGEQASERGVAATQSKDIVR
jgi:Protein of unknown function (DUF3631)